MDIYELLDNTQAVEIGGLNNNGEKIGLRQHMNSKMRFHGDVQNYLSIFLTEMYKGDARDIYIKLYLDRKHSLEN